MSNIEERLIKLEILHGNLLDDIKELEMAIDNNSQRLALILNNTESLDKILKFVVTPLIVILGGLVGIQVTTG